MRVCPHREKGVRHYISKCKACPEADKDSYLADYCKEQGGQVKKEQKAQGFKTGANNKKCPKRSSEPGESSIVFRAVLCELHHETVCDDNGADGNIMDEATLRWITSTGTHVDVRKLPHPPVFDMTAVNPNGAKATMVCKEEVSIDIELHIRHGTALNMRNLKWLITAQHLSEPLLGRPILEALELNTRDLLTSAFDRLAGNANTESLVSS